MIRPPTHFPLRWESTGDQWWYASPIDWAAANGHYDLVRELLHIDANHLIKLTSLRRIRRLETVWDDEEQFHDDVAKCRSDVARKLLVECEIKKGKCSLIGAGYGGWLLYTAASAGDLCFVRELLERDPLLVFGEGEYGVTDILYAAARSKDPDVFKVVFDFAASPRFSTADLQQSGGGEVPITSSCYKLEILNRALHAAARGGNLTLLKELLATCSDDALTAYRDIQGATVLHAAAARGQLEVFKYLASSYSGIINSTDNQGNTALHVAAHRGHLPIVEALILASPSSIYAANNAGETFLHAVVASFQTPGFRRLDRQIELLKHLLRGRLFDIKEIINAENKEGRTALHLAIMRNVHFGLVELLMTIRGINLNICDADGMTPLDVLRRRPHSASSELLTRQLISAGGIFFSSGDYSATRVVPSHIKRQSIGSSPGTSFRISDFEIITHLKLEKKVSDGSPSAGMEKNVSDGSFSAGLINNYSPEVSRSHDSNVENHCSLPRKTDKMGSVNYALSQRLKRFLQWPKMKKETTSERIGKLADRTCASASERVLVPLRQRFLKPSSLANNKRALSVRSNAPSPAAKKKLASGVMHGFMQAVSSFTAPHRSRSSSFSTLSLSSKGFSDPQKGASTCSKDTAISEGGAKNSIHRHCDGAANKKLMNQYLCFGSTAQHVEAPTGDQQSPPYDIYVRSDLSVA